MSGEEVIMGEHAMSCSKQPWNGKRERLVLSRTTSNGVGTVIISKSTTCRSIASSRLDEQPPAQPKAGPSRGRLIRTAWWYRLQSLLVFPNRMRGYLRTSYQRAELSQLVMIGNGRSSGNCGQQPGRESRTRAGGERWGGAVGCHPYFLIRRYA
jgi:hypothetical protein